MKLEEYRYVNQKKMRCGYTTGTCASAAAKAATYMLLSREEVKNVEVTTPKGVSLVLPVIETEREENYVSCAIQKDSGDDSDVTNGVLVYATVTKKGEQIVLDGGIGIGRVTKSGLDQPVGEAAINTVPRKMILKEVEEVADQFDYMGGLEVIISIPDGVKLAEKTFNPNLGIIGGLSVLGTSGIVEPMSEKALVDTIRVELKMHKAQGKKYIILTPGNYGECFLKEQLQINLKDSIKCSNFIGETIDMVKEFQFEGLLLVGHIGKLVKLGAGIMNTHSRWADGRMEVLVTCALLAGADVELMKKMSECVSTDDMIAAVCEQGLREPVMKQLLLKIEKHMKRRCGELQFGVIVFSNQYGLLGQTPEAKHLLELVRIESEMLGEIE